MAQLLRDFVKVENDFTIIPNEILRNKEMKSSTKNILLTMFSLPPNWDFSIAGISTCVKEGRDNVQKALVELEKIGYITRKRERKPNGTLGVMIYTIHQFPVSEDKNTYKKNFSGNQHTENPKQVKPILDSKAQLRTDNKLNTDCSNTDNYNMDNKLNDIDSLRTKNSFSNEKDNSQETWESNNSRTEEYESHISMSLGVKQKAKETPLKDMPTRAKEIADKLVDRTELSDGVYDCIEYFLEKYKAKNRKEHLPLRNDTLQRVVETMLSSITVPHYENLENKFQTIFYPLVCFMTDWEDRKEVIDRYFDTEFNYIDEDENGKEKKMEVDYSLVHFTHADVITHIMQKCHIGADIEWYESEHVN